MKRIQTVGPGYHVTIISLLIQQGCRQPQPGLLLNQREIQDPAAGGRGERLRSTTYQVSDHERMFSQSEPQFP